MIRILIADDHLLFRSMLEEMLRRDNEFEIIAACSNGNEVLDCCQKKSIDNKVFDAVEIRIIQLIVQGKTNKEIGTLLTYREGTIKNKISKLLSVTGFSDRTELSVFAINHGIV